jgi:hypothetical protein
MPQVRGPNSHTRAPLLTEQPVHQSMENWKSSHVTHYWTTFNQLFAHPQPSESHSPHFLFRHSAAQPTWNLVHGHRVLKIDPLISTMEPVRPHIYSSTLASGSRLRDASLATLHVYVVVSRNPAPATPIAAPDPDKTRDALRRWYLDVTVAKAGSLRFNRLVHYPQNLQG